MTHDRDQSGSFRPRADPRQEAPAVERFESEIHDERVETLEVEAGDSSVAVADDGGLGIVGMRTGRTRAGLDHEHAGNHRVPPP